MLCRILFDRSAQHFAFFVCLKVFGVGVWLRLAKASGEGLFSKSPSQINLLLIIRPRDDVVLEVAGEIVEVIAVAADTYDQVSVFFRMLLRVD